MVTHSVYNPLDKKSKPFEKSLWEYINTTEIGEREVGINVKVLIVATAYDEA